MPNRSPIIAGITAHWPSEAEPVRLDSAVTALFPVQVWSRAAAKKLCKAGNVQLDDVVAGPSRWVRGGARIAITPSQTASTVVYNQTIPVIFEDEYIAVVHKPAGIITSGNRQRTLAHTLVFNLTPSPHADALLQPWPAHRLDAATSGLVLVGKTGSALAALNLAFQEHRIAKTYVALVRGALTAPIDAPLRITEPIDERPATTLVWPQSKVRSARCGWITAVRVEPLSGRTHQIRKHLAAIDHPVMGDPLYTLEPPRLSGSGIYLCALKLAFQHPVTGAHLEPSIQTPNKFSSLLRRAPLAWERSQVRK